MWSSNRTLLYDNKTATHGNTFHNCLPHMHPDAITIMQVPNFLMLMPRPTSDPTKRRNVKPISESRSIPMSRWRDSRIMSTRTTNGTKKNVQKAPHPSRQRTKLGPETHNPTWNTQGPGYACVAVLEQYLCPIYRYKLAQLQMSLFQTLVSLPISHT